MRKLWIGIVIIVILVLAITIIVTQVKQETKGIKIGVILPLSGNAAWLGEQHRWGMDIAVNEINAAGGINGKKLELVYEDDKNESLEAVNAFNKIWTIYKVPVVFSVSSSSAMAIYPKAEGKKVVLYANCGHPEIADLSKWTFRNFLTSLQETNAMANLCIEKFVIKELGVLYVDDAYGVGGYDVFTKTYTGLGGKILADEKYDKNGTDFRTEITKLLSKTPKTIYIIGYGKSTAILLNQLKELRYNGLILGTNNFSGPPINEMALTALEGSIFTAPQFYSASNNAKMIEFGNKVKGLYGKEAQWNTAVEYDAIYIVAKAIKNAKSYNGDEVRNALEQIGDFDGLAGKYRYSPNGEWVLELAVRTYKNGIQIPLDK